MSDDENTGDDETHIAELRPEDCDIDAVPFELEDVADEDYLASLSDDQIAELEQFTAYLHERGSRLSDEERKRLRTYFLSG